MRKYFDTVLDPRGEPVLNASIWVKDNTGAPVAVYSDQAGSRITQPVRSNALGYFEFFVADGVYTLEISYQSAPTRVIKTVEIWANEPQQVSIDRLRDDVDFLLSQNPPLPGAVAVIIENKAALAAVVGQSDQTPVYLTQENEEGTFVWRLGDFTEQVANDPDQDVYVASDAVAPSDGAWVRSSNFDILSFTSIQEFFASGRLADKEIGTRATSKDGGAWDIVAAGSGDFDHPVTGVGVKVIAVNGQSSVEAFNIVGDGSTDNAAYVGAMNARLAAQPIKLAAGEGVFRSSVPFKFNGGLIGAGLSKTVFQNINDGQNHADTGAAEIVGPGFYSGFTGDGDTIADPAAWNSSNYDNFTGRRGVYIRSGGVTLSEVGGRNSRASGIAAIADSGVLANLLLINCATTRTRGQYGDGFYFVSVEQLSVINCTADDYTRIGFVTEGSGARQPSYRVSYENCRAGIGHDPSILYGGTQYNAGFWDENTSQARYENCISEGSTATGNVSRGFTTAFARGVTVKGNIGQTSYVNCYAKNSYRGFTNSGLMSNPREYQTIASYVGCATEGCRIGWDASSSASISVVDGRWTYDASGNTANVAVIMVSGHSSSVRVNGLVEVWKGLPDDTLLSSGNITLGSFVSISGNAPRLLTIENWSNESGDPIIVKTLGAVAENDTLDYSVSNCRVRPIRLVSGGDVRISNSEIETLGAAGEDHFIQGRNLFIDGGGVRIRGGGHLQLSTHNLGGKMHIHPDMIQRFSSATGQVRTIRSGSTASNGVWVRWGNVRFRANLSSGPLVYHWSDSDASRNLSGQSHAFMGCSIELSSGTVGADSFMNSRLNDMSSNNRFYFQGCLKSPAIGALGPSAIASYFPATNTVIDMAGN